MIRSLLTAKRKTPQNLGMELFDRRGRRVLAVVFWLAAAALILAFRLGLVRNHAFAHPYWDQWHSEGATLVEPWLEDRLRPSDLFAPNSEHRILFTRLVQLALLATDGQWDSLTQVVTNALLFSIGAIAFLWTLLENPTKFTSQIAVVSFFVLFCLPIGWANTLWGFQSQFYFLTFLSLCAISITAQSPPLSAQWWVAYVISFLSFLGMAGGMITPVVCAILQLIKGFRCQESRGTRACSLVLWSVQAVALYLWIPFVPGNSVKAADLSDLIHTLLQCIAFPFSHLSAAIPSIAILGVSVVAALSMRSAGKWRNADWAVLGCAIWTVGQALAIAYSRGGGAPSLPHRYHDTLVILPLSGAVLLWRLPHLFPCTKVTPFFLRALAGVFTTWLIVGLSLRIRDAAQLWLPQRDAEFVVQEQNLRAFVYHGDTDRFSRLPSNETGSYLAPSRLVEFLNKPAVRQVLSSSIREPVKPSFADGPHMPNEPGPLASFEAFFSTHKFGASVLVAFEMPATPSVKQILHGLRIGAIIVPGPRLDGTTRVSLITKHSLSPGSPAHSLLINLQAKGLTLPRAIGPLGIAARFLLSIQPVIFVVALAAMLATVVIRGYALTEK